MIEINYEFLQNIFDSVWGETDFNNFVIGLKAITISFLIFRFIHTIARDTLKTRTFEMGAQKVTMPITLWHILTYVGYAALIATYDHFLGYLDMGLGWFVNHFQQFDTQALDIQLWDSDQVHVPGAESVWETLQTMALEVIKVILNPALWILTLLKVIIWIADIIAYGLFVGERFFILMILKITGPIALCLSLLPSLGHTFAKWLTLYTRWYFLIIPYLLVNLVINGFITAYEAMFASFGAGASLQVANMQYLLEVPLLLLLVILKFMLYRGGKRLYEQLIDINLKEEQNDG